MPSGDQVDVELSRFSTGKEILEGLLNEKVAPWQTPQGDPISYELISRASNVRIEENKTLNDLGILNGETILLIPRLGAEAQPKKIT